jgi:hypothetical protein
MYEVHNHASTSVFVTKYIHVTTSKRMRWQEAEMQTGFFLVEKSDRKQRLLGLKHTQEDDMKVDLQERNWSTYWIYLA